MSLVLSITARYVLTLPSFCLLPIMPIPRPVCCCITATQNNTSGDPIRDRHFTIYYASLHKARFAKIHFTN